MRGRHSADRAGGAADIAVDMMDNASALPTCPQRQQQEKTAFRKWPKITHTTSRRGKVYNGDIGYIDDVDPNAGEIATSFDGRSVTYGFGELDMLVPAYAATIHKSQGSEYPAVIIPMLTQHYAMLQRNLLYTGVTRGKRLVVLVGQKKAVAIAVRNVSGRRRWSKLSEWLRPKPPVSRQFGMAS